MIKPDPKLSRRLVRVSPILRDLINSIASIAEIHGEPDRSSL